MHSLVHAKQVCRRNTRPTGADIQRFGQLNEFQTRRIRGTKEYGNLNLDPSGSARLDRFIPATILQLFGADVHWYSTRELVQNKQVACQFVGRPRNATSFIISELEGMNRLLTNEKEKRLEQSAQDFPKSANGTHLPLTARQGSGTMASHPWEKIFHRPRG